MKEADELSDFKPCEDAIPISEVPEFCQACLSNLPHETRMKPVTPLLDRENQSAPSSSCRCEEANTEVNPETPTGNRFDPFAPGEGLIFAPMKKSAQKVFDPIQRKLDFDSCIDSNEAPDKEEPPESICRSLSDAGITVSDGDDSAPSSTGEAGDMEWDPLSISKAAGCPPLRDPEELGEGCQTPRESTLDSFAPGPEELMFAPKKKTTRKAQIPVQRKLDFDSFLGQIHQPVEERTSKEDEDEEEEEEETFLEKVCKSLLDVIISSEPAAPTDGQRTPPAAPLLNGVAETCPGAPPSRRVLQVRKLDPKICRKLEF